MEELGDFLRSRRARLSPAAAGIRGYGERRRVPGLRREELAQLAGVSVAYYTRLEQGLSRNASDGVLDALAQALRLDSDESAHLHAIARPARSPARPRQKPEHASAGARAMLAALGEVPALVNGPRTDILAWTPMGHALLLGHVPFESPADPATRPNLIKHIFCDPHTRELYLDWKTKANDAVAYLRLLSGRHPDDPRLMSLIGELSMQCQDFARLWAGHAVRQCGSGRRSLRHPLVGTLVLNEVVMDIVGEGQQRVVVYSADPGSAAENGLRLLARSIAAATRLEE